MKTTKGWDAELYVRPGLSKARTRRDGMPSLAGRTVRQRELADALFSELLRRHSRLPMPRPWKCYMGETLMCSYATEEHALQWAPNFPGCRIVREA